MPLIPIAGVVFASLSAWFAWCFWKAGDPRRATRYDTKWAPRPGKVTP